MRTAETMTKDEKSLLLYLEHCAVDASGRVMSSKMNKEDFAIAEKWNKEGFITFWRLLSEYIGEQIRGYTTDHVVSLSYPAWALAHEIRRTRAERMIDKDSGTKESLARCKKKR